MMHFPQRPWAFSAATQLGPNQCRKQAAVGAVHMCVTSSWPLALSDCRPCRGAWLSPWGSEKPCGRSTGHFSSPSATASLSGAMFSLEKSENTFLDLHITWPGSHYKRPSLKGKKNPQNL